MTFPAYVPPAAGMPWETVAPEQAGFDRAAIAAATQFALAHETKWRRDIRAQLEAGNFEPPPDNEIIGPTAPRSGPNGLLLRHGRIVTSWGDTGAVDMTFSVAKSYLSILAGLAVDDGLIADIDEPIGATVRDGGFDSPHNARVTWRHMLTQTSEWEGTLFGKSDMIDRNRSLANETDGRPAQAKGQPRPLQAPGGFWEYNDVRVNRLSLALLRRFGRALPDVFAERIMNPIGASAGWLWHGYHNSFVDIGGARVQSVSGGGHWGGGVFMHARDQARIGLLMSRSGQWGDRRLLSADWIARSLAPCPLRPDYGMLWWLNTGGTPRPGAPADSYFANGAGGNHIWVAPGLDVVAVLRWIDASALDAWIGQIVAAVRG